MFKKQPTKENYAHLKELCAKVLKRQNRKDWRILVGTFSTKTPTAQIWSLIRTFMKRELNFNTKKEIASKHFYYDFSKKITIFFCISATSYFVPPFFIFSRQRLNRLMINSPAKSEGVAMNSEFFLQWMQHFTKFVRPSKETPVLLLLNGNSSHLADRLTNWAVSRKVKHLGVPTGFFIDQTPYAAVGNIISDLSAIDRSLLAPWQKVETLGTFILPRLDFLLRGARVFKDPFTRADSAKYPPFNKGTASRKEEYGVGDRSEDYRPTGSNKR
ncbi:hypothetical protein ALC56_04095 [Trachymyrmex septentrionalis]|uniref:DDE-1 domain-containing protein n=1 Tax=Trachymyrmex septentrionalis TaxID=34720 RepID=A0A151JYN1_9HYME|nr:hypothetical protein ALC56_04095 [Trachymyrmex septentrionalis]